MHRFLVTSFVFACSSLALGIVPASAQEAPGKKIKVFILSGQSGMAGFGRSHELPDALREGNDRVLMFEDGKWQPLRPFFVYNDKHMKKFGLSKFSNTLALASLRWIAEAWRTRPTSATSLM